MVAVAMVAGAVMETGEVGLVAAMAAGPVIKTGGVGLVAAAMAAGTVTKTGASGLVAAAMAAGTVTKTGAVAETDLAGGCKEQEHKRGVFKICPFHAAEVLDLNPLNFSPWRRLSRR